VTTFFMIDRDTRKKMERFICLWISLLMRCLIAPFHPAMIPMGI
jgi:hypothetical protein